MVSCENAKIKTKNNSGRVRMGGCDPRIKIIVKMQEKNVGEGGPVVGVVGGWGGLVIGVGGLGDYRYCTILRIIKQNLGCGGGDWGDI